MLLVVRWPAGLTQVTEIVSPGWNRARTLPSWSGEPTGCPLIAVMTAPPVRPAWAAGPPQIVPSTRTPEETGAMAEGAASPALLAEHPWLPPDPYCCCPCCAWSCGLLSDPVPTKMPRKGG